MKKRVSSILILIFIMIVIFCTISCNNTNITNAFFASGNNVDMYMPKVNVSNYTENAIVRGPVVFCGEASDDIWVYSVELYYICLFKNEDGTHEMRDVRIAAAKQSGKNIKWEIPCDTTLLPDASTIFRIRVIDDASNIYMRNLTLRLDNHGPDIMINSPVANKKQNAIDNTFVCAVVPIEIDINRISQLNWRLVKNDNPKVFISGIENYQDNPLPSNKTCSFYINPFGLTECEGYEPGYYHLEIIGYSVPDGTTGELGKPSQKAAISDNLYIDFSGSVPKVMLTAPSSTNRSLPTISSSSVVFAGAAVDDNGVDNVELRWGHDGSDEPIGEQKLTFDTPSLSRTFAYTEQNLAEGLYWVQVRATDIMPNVSGWSEKYYFRVDTNLPTISWNSPIQGQWYRSGVTFSSDMSILGDNVALTNVQFRLPPKYSDWITVPAANLVNPDDMSAIVLPSQRVRLQYALPDNDDLYKSGGEYVFGLRAFKSENEFTESSIVVNLDCQPPVTAILSPQSDTQSLNQMLHINGTALDKIGIQSDDDGIIRDVTLDIRWGSTHSVTIPSSEIIGVSNWSYDFDSWAAGIGMENGGEPVNITFTASDYAGNTTVSNVTVTVDQSTDIPTVNVNNFADGDKKYGIFTVTGIAADDDGIQTVQVFMTDNTTDATEDVLRNEMNMLTGRVGEWSRASGMSIWTYMLNLSEVPQGIYRFFYRSVDLNGKPSTYGGLYQGVRFFVDPDIPIIDFDLDTYLSAPKSFSGTVTKNAAAGDDVTVAKIEYRLASTQASGSWTSFVVGQNMTYDDASQRSAAFRLDYNQSLIDRFGQGEVTVYIRATDSSDRQSVVSSKTFVDTIAPTATLSALTNNVIRQNSVIISGGVSDEEPSSGLYSDGCSLRYSYNGQNYETAVNGASIGGLSSFSTAWTIPSTVKDGVIDIRLFAADKAGNELGSSAALQNVRLARYTPKLSNITINGVAAADYMYVRKDVNISCHIEDNDPNDTAVKGVTKIGVYAIKSANFSQYNIDSENVSGFVMIAEQTYAASPTSVDWTKSYSFSQSYDYILFRAFDKAGGWSDKVYHITVDSVAPTEAFRYSTVGHVYMINSGSNHVGDHKWSTSRSNYSDTLWVKLEAQDKLNSADAYSELTGTTAVLGVGTSTTENDIAEAKIYTLGSGIAKFDLKGLSVPLYLNYKIADKAGNETVGFKRLTSSDRPPVTSDIDTKWVREATLNTLTAETTSGSMKYSKLDFDAADGAVNNLTLGTDMFGSSSVSTTVDCLAANGGMSLTSGRKYSIIFIATRDSGLDAYEEKSFTYDNTAPFMSDVTVSEDFGAVYGRADTVNKRLSGKVTFSGYFHDYALGEQESAGDFSFTVTVGTKTETAVITKTDELIGDYVKFLWNCEVDLSSLSCGSKTFTFSLKDKADNESLKTESYTVAPFIREIVEVSGAVKSVMRYGKPFDNAADSWCNTNYNERYSLRQGVTSIVVKGFNLNGADYKYGSSTLSKSNAAATGATLTISASAGSGSLTATNGTIVSDPKSITVFKNYTTLTNYKSMHTADMVLKDNNMALITFQYNTSKHTFVLREYENSEGSFAVNTTNTGTYIAAGYNRFWFINLCMDKKDDIAAQSNLADNKYYILASDSEYNKDLHAQKGLQLWGRYNYWKDSSDIALCRTWMSAAGPNDDQGEFVKMPRNDWRVVEPGSNYTYGRYNKKMIEYKNHWRMSMPNDTSNGYDGGHNNPAAQGGTSNISETSANAGTPNSPPGTADWSSDWGDVAAYNDKIHTVWHSLYDNKMYYRMLVNGTNTDSTSNSVKYPDGGAVQFPFDGKYPAVTVADNNRPLIIAYDETNRKLKAFYYNGTITNISSLTQSGDSNWKSYEIASGEGVGLYPRIECQLNSAGTAIEGGVHLFYQDAQTGALCYGYASEIANLSSTTKIVIDTDCAPGYYNDIRIDGGYVTCTYIAYGNLGTGDAIRAARCSVSADTTDRSNWEIITLPSSHSIIENKVRGYFASTNKMVCFGMSSENGPELFREY